MCRKPVGEGAKRTTTDIGRANPRASGQVPCCSISRAGTFCKRPARRARRPWLRAPAGTRGRALIEINARSLQTGVRWEEYRAGRDPVRNRTTTDEARSQMYRQTLCSSPAAFRRSIVAGTVLALAGLGALSLATPSRADWQSDLRDQLLHEQNCGPCFCPLSRSVSSTANRSSSFARIARINAPSIASRADRAARFRLQLCDKHVTAC